MTVAVLILLAPLANGLARRNDEESTNALPADGLGSTARLNENGYASVAALENDEEMRTFVRRVLARQHLVVLNEGSLSGFVQWYNGKLAVQSYSNMTRDLKQVDWVASMGNYAPLNEEGFQLVSASGNDEEMKIFITRFLESTGRKAARAGVVSGFAPFYVGNTKKKFQDLKFELSRARWVKPLTWPEQASLLALQGDKKGDGVAEIDGLDGLEGLSLTQTGAAVHRVRLNHSSFLELPGVDTYLEKATSTLDHFVAHAVAVQDKVAAAQEKSRVALEAQRAQYEANLTEQAEQNRAIALANGDIRQKISAVNRTNVDLKTSAVRLRKSNKILRDMVAKLSSRLDMSSEFLSASLNATDDSDAPSLEVLVPTTPKPDLDYFLGQARSDLGLGKGEGSSDDDRTSLLQVANGAPRGAPKVRMLRRAARKAASLASVQQRKDPEEFVQAMSKGLERLSVAQKSGLDELQSKFEASFKQGATVRARLLEQQKALNASYAKAEELSRALGAARDHLEGERAMLQERLNAFRTFAERLDATMTSAEEEAESVAPAAHVASLVAMGAVPSKVALAAHHQGHHHHSRLARGVKIHRRHKRNSTTVSKEHKM